MNKEYILCAAIVRLKPSTTKTGNYKTNSNECDDIYFIEIGRRHNDILARFGKKKLDVNRQGCYYALIDGEDVIYPIKKFASDDIEYNRVCAEELVELLNQEQ